VDFRCNDKADPDYYARHAVQKAQDELKSAQANFRPGDTELADVNKNSREK